VSASFVKVCSFINDRTGDIISVKVDSAYFPITQKDIEAAFVYAFPDKCRRDYTYIDALFAFRQTKYIGRY
jgi:hypothetical protein